LTDWLSELRAISVRQPYASALFSPDPGRRKTVENRTWNTRHRGRLYIHASRKIDWQATGEYWGDDDDYDLPTGCLIGHVDLLDVTRDSESRWAASGKFHWILGNPVLLPRPVPCPGKLGLWFIPGLIAEGLE
jgi:hypothetical protein